MSKANYELPESTLNKVRKLSGAKTKREAIIIALNEFLKVKQIEKLIKSRGKISLNWDTQTLRKYRG